MTERLGGIYALEHVMLESESEHETIVAVLSAFIREGVPLSSAEIEPRAESGRRSEVLATDVQAALTVLCRRPDRLEAYPIDLCFTDLRGARMAHARLDGALFEGSFLRGCDFFEAKLRGCEMKDADLQGAILERADFNKAYMGRANLADVNAPGVNFDHATLNFAVLSGGSLWDAKFRSARMWKCDLEDANLMRADLSSALMSSASLKSALLAGANLTQAEIGEVDLTGASFVDWAGDSELHALGLTVDQLAEAKLDEIGEISADLLRKARERRVVVLKDREVQARLTFGDALYEELAGKLQGLREGQERKPPSAE
ncbi:pentapeptide repeat-containing protein [Micromonospora sp. NPDC049275]|uniref:pentapeptide repeat-containing protein n=1 Tax=Micromonospora sp. NPDC049275 TaxID=3364268 RepID=UPI0037162942